jgi:hypothetical protein
MLILQLDGLLEICYCLLALTCCCQCTKYRTDLIDALILWRLTVWSIYLSSAATHTHKSITLKVPNFCQFLLLVRVVLGGREVGSIGWVILVGKTEVLWEKSVPLPICPPKILHLAVFGVERARGRFVQDVCKFMWDIVALHLWRWWSSLTPLWEP